ncbi:enoyl-CoA hydratase/isomerase family protein [Bradyrhizobium vignae]|uniref:enoyl-CoA hydratase/isomerase family protein n=1 Tax=Bradyrhizobium vignae TaxID=1549949 RepID=UPI00100C0720|nr:enoyl-CoA hydratase/isomerase family protein [Bradyrhizobium vignae]RXH04318.1 enoyl-CoA hydratase/isomerase family protein [Bradyrhizobium vignae]
MTQPSTITVESRGAIDILTLNRPTQLNAVSPDMIAELSVYFSDLHDRPTTRVVLLRGNGPQFSAGADLGSDAFAAPGKGRPQSQLKMQQNYSGVIRLMRSCPQPIIGLVHGAACGAGFSFVLACDVRFAAPDARMNAAYIRIGVGGCDMGSGYLLPRLVGLSVASEFLLTGRFLKAERAKAIGLVSDIVPAENLLTKGLELAEDMLRVSPMGLRMTKQALNTLIDAPSLDAALMMEDRQQVILLETHDHAEAVAAFRERRTPTYSDQ